ncbi:uncharacterized protein K452DRAFT_254951 [Aplosporella prunicola CBS 121167]|uniref:Uncharacterized protein n=1 Tax=Aplosporella prunicola CBS 121167 TaxID=1176127 RepID=A0A6A6B5N5_9PEZI|nr:uncharacterized protein K452DRAFT_254951 [Aplosporella prunicola CBS 121167]KAF2138938.1 hypothetical protein K452DRAFT_254951 [Aplosporella prunicola CBS 121167]
MTLLLLDAGGDVNTRTANGSTPLHWSARAGNPRTMELLLRNGSDHKKITTDGSTPLHWAVAYANFDGVVNLLFEAGVNLRTSASSEIGRTAVQAAVANGHLRVAELLVEAGADGKIPATVEGGKLADQAASSQTITNLGSPNTTFKLSFSEPKSSNVYDKVEDGLDIPWRLGLRSDLWDFIDDKVFSTNSKLAPEVAFTNHTAWTEIMQTWVIKEALEEAHYSFKQVQNKVTDERGIRTEAFFRIEMALKYPDVRFLIDRSINLYRASQEVADLTVNGDSWGYEIEREISRTETKE